jgi:hypothetical protein
MFLIRYVRLLPVLCVLAVMIIGSSLYAGDFFTEERMGGLIKEIVITLLGTSITSAGYACILIGGSSVGIKLAKGDDSWFKELAFVVAGIAILGGLYAIASNVSFSGGSPAFDFQGMFGSQIGFSTEVQTVCNNIVGIIGGLVMTVSIIVLIWKLSHGELFTKALIYAIVGFSVVASTQFGLLNFGPSS